MIRFIRLWIAGFYNPSFFIERLRDIPAPFWGFYATLVRASMVSLFQYLPLFLAGKSPPLRSFIPFIPTEKYYGALIAITPIVFLALWLVDAAVIHLLLRLGKRESDIDRILNLSGMATLVVGTFILIWDWSSVLLTGMNQYVLGISHLIIDIYWIFLFALGLKKLLNVPVWLGILLALLTFAIDLPVAYMLMRAPG